MKQPVPAIVLNAAEIKFGTVTAEVGGKQLHATVTLDEEKEQATLNFGQIAPAGPLTLHIDYTGILNNELRGFYLSKTKTRNYAVTQFEPTDARRAFPSFDEPAFKATFNVTLVVDKGDTAISNTERRQRHAGTGAGRAHRALRHHAEDVDLPGGVPCRRLPVHLRAERRHADPRVRHSGQAALRPFALAAAEFNLHYYNKYFGIKYPMPKLDLIGIPDFEAGAMENFGAITFRETALFVDEKTALAGRQRRMWPRTWRTRWRTSGSATW